MPRTQTERKKAARRAAAAAIDRLIRFLNDNQTQLAEDAAAGMVDIEEGNETTDKDTLVGVAMDEYPTGVFGQVTARIEEIAVDTAAAYSDDE